VYKIGRLVKTSTTECWRD